MAICGCSPGRRLGELHVHVGKVADVREHPDLGLSGLALDDRLEQAVDRELHVAQMVGKRRIGRHVVPCWPGCAVKRCRLLGMNWNSPRSLRDRQRSRVPDGEVLLARFRLVEIDRSQQRAVGAVRQLIAFRRRYRADNCGQLGLLSWASPPLRSNTWLYCSTMLRIGNAVGRHQRQVAVGAPDRQQSGQAEIGLRRGEGMKVAMVPIRALRHVLRDLVGVGVGHPGRDVQHHVVGIALGTDVDAVNVKVDR